MKVICDTNIWYDIATGKIKKEQLAGMELYSSYVNLFELAKTPNLVIDWKLVKAAVRALHDNSKGIYETNPIEFIIQKQYPDYKAKDNSYKQILIGFEDLMDRPDTEEITQEVKEKMQKSVDEFAEAAQKSADNVNAKLPVIREKIKETIGKKEHRKIVSYPLIYDVINVFVGQQSQGEISLDIENYPWGEIELLVKTWDGYFKDLEVSGNQKFQPNDWQDIFVMSYVNPEYKFLTSEGKWKRLIEGNADTKKYLAAI